MVDGYKVLGLCTDVDVDVDVVVLLVGLWLWLMVGNQWLLGSIQVFFFFFN